MLSPPSQPQASPINKFPPTPGQAAATPIAATVQNTPLQTPIQNIKDEGSSTLDETESVDSNGSRKEQASPKQSRGSTRGVTLLVLIQENILEPGKGVLTIDYLGKNFTGDLSLDGKIYWKGMQFASPSSWAIHVKKQINPSKKSGCGWNSVKYKGKKLDMYKSMWSKKSNNNAVFSSAVLDDENSNASSGSPRSGDNKIRHIYKYSQLKQMQGEIDPNTLVECISYESLGQNQQFAVTMTSNCKVLIDFHCHLTSGEVVGYLGGKWDHSKLCKSGKSLRILQAFPCRCSLGDKENANIVEREIKQAMAERGLHKVGWYHSHPSCPAEPTFHDIECQWEYQVKFNSANPVVAVICSPFDHQNPAQNESVCKMFWVAQTEVAFQSPGIGKPMDFKYTDVPESQLFQDTLREMSWLVEYYKTSTDLMNFSCAYRSNTVYLDKLKQSLSAKLPNHLINGLLQYVNQILSSAVSNFSK